MSISLEIMRLNEKKRFRVEFYREYTTSNARLKTRLALSRTNRVSEVSPNYLFKEKMLFTSCSAISIFSRLLNISH